VIAVRAAGLAAALGLILAGCPSGGAGSSRRADPEPIAERPRENLSRTPELDVFFAKELTRWLVELSGTPEAAQRPVIPTSAGKAVGAALAELFSAAEVVARHRASDADEPPDLTPLTNRVNSALRAQGLGYAIDSFVTDGFAPEHPDAVLLFSFALERERIYRDESGREHAVAWGAHTLRRCGRGYEPAEQCRSAAGSG
jgi:hypothetical protein